MPSTASSLRREECAYVALLERAIHAFARNRHPIVEAPEPAPVDRGHRVDHATLGRRRGRPVIVKNLDALWSRRRPG